MTSPAVTVILPTYDRVESTQRAARSVLAQTFDDWELLVVDDGSAEPLTAELLGLNDSRIRVIAHDSNRGASAARNTGIREARGDFLAFIDSDAEWSPSKLEKQLDRFRSSSFEQLGVVLCGMRQTGGGRQHDTVPLARGQVFDRVLRRRIGVWDTSAFLVRRDCNVMFDESFPAYQDFDFLAQITRDYQLDCVDEILVTSHIDTPGPRVSDRNLEGRLATLSKYETELKQRPEILSHHHVRIAVKQYHRGVMSAARSHLRAAALAYPYRIQHWAWLGAAWLGQSSLRFALKVFRHETLH